MFEFRETDVLESAGPTLLSRDVSHETRITEYDEIEMPKEPARPEIQIVEEIPVDDVFGVHEDHSVACFRFERPTMKTAQPAKFKHFLGRKFSAACSGTQADINIVISAERLVSANVCSQLAEREIAPVALVCKFSRSIEAPPLLTIGCSCRRAESRAHNETSHSAVVDCRIQSEEFLSSED